MRPSLAISVLFLAGCQITLADETAKYDGGGCTVCGADECVDVSSDPEHCGGCDVQCTTDEACVAGECVAGCPAETTECPTGMRFPSTVCAHLDSNMEHCGGCGRECTLSRASGFPVCTAPGSCRAAGEGEPQYVGTADALSGGSVRVYEFSDLSVPMRPVCFDGFDAVAGGIVCGFFGLVYRQHEAAPGTSIDGIRELACTGDEAVLTECAHGLGPCPDDEIVRLTCALP